MPKNQPTQQSRLMAIFAILLSALALVATIWIVVEPPVGFLWLLAIGATEWSLYFGALGLLGSLLGITALLQGARRPGVIAIVTGLISVVLSPLPLIEAIPAANANGVSLSVSEYLRFNQDPSFSAVQAKTETFASAGSKPLDLDIYRSPALPSAAGAPAVIVVHGGSWHQGHRSDFETWDRWLATAGYTVFDIDYRLGPQPNWKLAAGDVKAAVGWVRRNARRLGIDAGRIALMGRSAGAHLALLAAYTAGDPALPPTGGDREDTHVRSVISFYGPTDLIWGYDNTPTPDVIHSQTVLSNFLGGSPATAPIAYREGSPIDHVGAATPPTLLVHGRRDLIVCTQHSIRLEAKLRAERRDVRAVYIPYALHGFDFNFHGWGSQIVKPVLLRFLQDSLGPPAAPRASDKL